MKTKCIFLAIHSKSLKFSGEYRFMLFASEKLTRNAVKSVDVKSFFTTGGARSTARGIPS